MYVACHAPPISVAGLALFAVFSSCRLCLYQSDSVSCFPSNHGHPGSVYIATERLREIWGYRGTYALVVDDLDDGGQLAGVGALVQKENAADLDQAPLGGDDGGFTHFGGDLERSGSERTGSMEGRGEGGWRDPGRWASAAGGVVVYQGKLTFVIAQLGI